MCGLSGQLSLDGSAVDRALVRRMTRMLVHRGPDGSGHYFSDTIGIGHRRLSIIDHDGGAQPMLSDRGTLCLATNGEIYNYVELRRELSSAGVSFRTDSDTEVLLKCLERDGPAAIARLEGMYAFAFWDEADRTLLLARDPVGIKPLYYYQDGSYFLFASELKSLLAYPRLNRELNLGAVDRYFESLAVPEPDSVLRGVRKVPAGHYLTVQRGRVSLTRYWAPRAGARRRRRSDHGRARDLNLELHRTVQLSLRSDVPVGVLLSGGVDSSGLAALASVHSPRRLHTFSAAFREQEFDESPASRAVARHLRTSHHEILVTSKVAAGIAERLMTRIDEPFADSSSIPTYAVCQLAARHVKAVLSGEGADELFGGYPWHVPRRTAGPGADSGRHPSRTIFGVADRQRLYAPRWRRAMQIARRRRLRHRQPFGVSPRSALDRALLGDLQEYLPSDILFKSDRMSMAHSLEVRVPYLNARFVQYAMSLPDRLKVNRGIQKYLLKRAVAKLLPPLIVKRPKKGFSVPMDMWLWQKGPWRDLVYDTLFSARTRERGQFDMQVLAEMRHEHDTLARLHGYRLWTVFVFEAWQRAFLDTVRA